MILGGFVDVWYYEPWYSVYIGIYSMLVGAILFPLLWPFEPLRCLVYPFQVYWLAAFILAMYICPRIARPASASRPVQAHLPSLVRTAHVPRSALSVHRRSVLPRGLHQGRARPNAGAAHEGRDGAGLSGASRVITVHTVHTY